MTRLLRRPVCPGPWNSEVGIGSWVPVKWSWAVWRCAAIARRSSGYSRDGTVTAASGPWLLVSARRLIGRTSSLVELRGRTSEQHAGPLSLLATSRRATATRAASTTSTTRPSTSSARSAPLTSRSPATPHHCWGWSTSLRVLLGRSRGREIGRDILESHFPTESFPSVSFPPLVDLPFRS